MYAAGGLELHDDKALQIIRIQDCERRDWILCVIPFVFKLIDVCTGKVGRYVVVVELR